MSETGHTYTERVLEALALAFELHGEQRRRGPGRVPYVTHLLGVASIVGEYGGDEDLFIAALLHDAAEDQGGQETLDRIEDMFGPHVAALVLACSDTLELPKPPWRERKEKHLAEAAMAAPEARLILAADKLHNMRSVYRGLRQHGEETWKAFKGGREGSIWYYESMYEALCQGWDHPILETLKEQLDALKGLAAQGE
jgi:(p)ppGpp synthase/HD superfamily hydrolase